MKGIWTAKTLFDARFQLPDDLMHPIMEILQLCALATAVLHIRPVKYMADGASNPEMFLFCLAVLLSHLYILALDLEIRFVGVAGQSSAKYVAVSNMLTLLPSTMFVVAATIYSGVVYYNQSGNEGFRMLAGDDSDKSSSDTLNHFPIILMLCSWLINHVINFPIAYFRGKGSEFKKFSIPLNVEFVIHRNGEWIMLMLGEFNSSILNNVSFIELTLLLFCLRSERTGESVLSLLLADVSDEEPAFYVTFYCGVLSVTLLQYLFFKSQPHHADGHAMRRARAAGFAYAFLVNIYSAALIIVGVGYKMLLEEYTIDVESAETSSSTSYLSRLLASGGGKPSYSTQERRQRIAYFFCISLAVVFLCLDFMSLAHKGIKASFERCYCQQNRLRVKGLFFCVILRLADTLFIGTACLYIIEPEYVALTGLVSIVLQIMVRLIGSKYFPENVEKSHKSDVNTHGHGKYSSQPSIIDDQYDDDQWPNRTQPLHIEEGG